MKMMAIAEKKNFNTSVADLEKLIFHHLYLIILATTNLLKYCLKNPDVIIFK
jgi:hypothetical protein